MRTPPAWRIAVLGLSTLALLELGCSTGEGSGEVHSDRLRVDSCWDGRYDMVPDFFAGVPFRSAFQIRVQRGNDIEEVSDGLSILVDDVHMVRGDDGQESLLGVPLEVGLPPEVTPPGIPVVPNANPPKVHMALYLHSTCFEQLVALYAVRGVIKFENLFNGDPNETNAEQRLTSAVFDVMVVDPRKQPPGGGPIAEDQLSRVTGWFRFYFERGQPAQPFP